MMVLAACEAAGATKERADAAAAALEMVHAYSLVHDDLPAMDDDVQRRGKPTAHVEYGEANAILVGDALLADAFGVLAEYGDLEQGARVRCVAILARAAGATGMVGGQVRDMSMSRPSEASLLQMHAEKTGALFVAATRLGAVCAGATLEVEESLAGFAAAFGEAFQISDDLLDASESHGRDEHEALVNLAMRVGPEAARARIRDATRAALDRLTEVPGPIRPLAALAHWVAGRAELPGEAGR